MKTLLAGLLAVVVLGGSARAQSALPSPDPSSVRSRVPLFYGTIASISWPAARHLRLIDGRYVDLHDYTAIDPAGMALKPGQHLAIRGYFAEGTREGHITLDAHEIVIIQEPGTNQ